MRLRRLAAVGLAVVALVIGTQAAVASAQTPALGPLIINVPSHACLTLTVNSTNVGPNADQWGCDPTNDLYQWTFNETSPGFYELINVATAGCLEVYGDSTSSGALAVQGLCVPRGYADYTAQQWYIDNQNNFSDGSYWIRNANSHQCLAIQGSSLANGALANQWGCNASLGSERWNNHN